MIWALAASGVLAVAVAWLGLGLYFAEQRAEQLAERLREEIDVRARAESKVRKLLASLGGPK